MLKDFPLQRCLEMLPERLYEVDFRGVGRLVDACGLDTRQRNQPSVQRQ